MRGYPVSAETKRRARELRAQGLIYREIAAELGVARSTVYAWLSDPDGERLRARKQGYAGTCIDCGAPTNGYDGPGRASKRCVPCNGKHTYALTHQWIVESFAEWVEMFGAPPTANDWNPAATRALPLERWKHERTIGTGRKWPPVVTVVNHFGSWNNALRELGYRALAPDERWIGRRGIALRDADEAAA